MDVKFTFMYNVKIGFKDFNLAFSSFSYSLLWRLPSNFVTVCYLKCCLHWYGIIIIITTEKTISEFLRKINILMKEKQAREIMTSSYSWSESPHSPNNNSTLHPTHLSSRCYKINKSQVDPCLRSKQPFITQQSQWFIEQLSCLKGNHIK